MRELVWFEVHNMLSDHEIRFLTNMNESWGGTMIAAMYDVQLWLIQTGNLDAEL